VKRDAYDVVVVGAGPAGLLAAGRAAMLGAQVLLLERMEKAARKLRITGKGRGNLTSMKPLEDYLKEIHPEPRFLRQAFGAFFNLELLALLAEAGIETKTERGERVFPTSDRAWDVAEALVTWAKAQGVEQVQHARVEDLLIEEGRITGLTLARSASEPSRRIRTTCAILATGGKSYPTTGSSGDGYRLAEQAGHRIEGLRPSLVELETRPSYPAAKGLSLKNVQVTLWLDQKKQGSEFGEALFTDKGLDGPTILRLSRRVVDALACGRRVELTLDLKPALEPAKLVARLRRELEKPQAKGGDLLRSLLPPPLIEPFAKAIGLDLALPVTRINGAILKKLLQQLKEMRFEVTGHGGWERAIVTAGGVCLKEIDPRSMASRKVAGLYFAGELMDLDANTGGFNLQIAFSTGWLAGESAASQAKHK